MTTDLRTQFQNYMTLQRFADHTQRTYVTGVKGLASFRPPTPKQLEILKIVQIYAFEKYLSVL